MSEIKAKTPTKSMCLSCKGGKLLCGQKNCPLLKKIDLKNPIQKILKKDMFGPAKNIFVGWKNYPNVNVGPLNAVDEDAKDILSDPNQWYGLGFDDIVYMRSRLVRGMQVRPVKDRSSYLEKMQEISLSTKPVDVEVNYVSAPKYSLKFNDITQPIGSTGKVKKMSLTENSHIPRKVDYVVNDELNANQQIHTLFENDYDVYYLSNVLSSGIFGRNERKKLVPTRWGITAVDDILAKNLIKDLKYCREINSITVFENEYLGNHFQILLIPGAWEFELFEAWSANTMWTEGASDVEVVADHEFNKGRKKYSYNEGGGYYAVRFAVADALKKMRKQARAVVFREIYDTYIMPVGVWEVRENVRKAFTKKGLKFNALNEALTHIQNKLKRPISEYIKKSQILKQRRLTDYMG